MNWNTRELLLRCLQRLIERVTIPHEVIVVDNASSDGSAEAVARRFPSVRLFANEDNLYYAAGNNQGIAASSGRHILLLNPDTEVRRGAVESLVCVLEEQSDAGATAPKLVHPDGRLQRSVRTFPSPDTVLAEFFLLSRLFPRSRVLGKYRMTWWEYDELRAVDQPMASCLMVRGDLLRGLGGFDESFPMFFNDVDLCYRVRQRGRRIYFVPGAVVEHHHGASTRLAKRRMVVASQQGLLQFYRKHYRGAVPALWYYAAIGVSWLAFGPRWLMAEPEVTIR